MMSADLADKVTAFWQRFLEPMFNVRRQAR